MNLFLELLAVAALILLNAFFVAAEYGGRRPVGRPPTRRVPAGRDGVALHALPGLPRVARRHRRDPPRPRPLRRARRPRARGRRGGAARPPRLRRPRDEGPRGAPDG